MLSSWPREHRFFGGIIQVSGESCMCSSSNQELLHEKYWPGDGSNLFQTIIPSISKQGIVILFMSYNAIESVGTWKVLRMTNLAMHLCQAAESSEPAWTPCLAHYSSRSIVSHFHYECGQRFGDFSQHSSAHTPRSPGHRKPWHNQGKEECFFSLPGLQFSQPCAAGSSPSPPKGNFFWKSFGSGQEL